MRGKIVVRWEPDLRPLHPQASATVTDESPPIDDLDPERAPALVEAGLGIRLADVRRVAAGPKEVAAWAVRHGETGAPGRVSVIVLPEGKAR